ncbi:RsbT co-antagonist protein RsbRB [Bhargavaea cecembensis]|uniref:RsbT co-antagonist protein RsbRB n=1 Tax=Bhargavaea cecembensis TaxID=394098 RepID=A0A161RI46_9BACL|nr:STAS domain-containing protein [Bhargavaea cecembensis]KZE37768.1 RsbT co-antagonist protein RsbRB [Bhargavaea cecembensis]
MAKYQELYDFLILKATELTEDWYEGLDRASSGGVYTTSDPKELTTLKSQNTKFHRIFFSVFIAEEKFLKELEDWIVMVASDQKHLETPSTLILGEFYRTRNQYLKLIRQFAALHEYQFSPKDKEDWEKLIISTMDKVTVWFFEEYDRHATKRLQAHRELINKLSSPVITITKNTGLLPLIGDIDSERANFILEHALRQSSEKRLESLYIDLSGVVTIDTMVAQQIFQLSEALTLLGVKTILCGIRPEIAQTAIHLGLSFENIPTYSTLENALNLSHM